MTTAKQAKTTCLVPYFAWCWPSGKIEVGSTVPPSALLLGIGTEQSLRDEIDVAARHGFQPGERLVPGVPEADSPLEAIDAVVAWVEWLHQRNVQKCLWLTGQQVRDVVEIMLRSAPEVPHDPA